MGDRFRATRDFYSPELRSQYVNGLEYTVRPGSKKLAALVPQWIKEGKAELVKPIGSKVNGRGTVSAVTE